MEASDEWQELEHNWSKFEAKAKQLGDAAADSTGDIRAAAALLGQEIKAGFKRIAKQLWRYMNVSSPGAALGR